MDVGTVYWFMLPVCIVIASAAMFSGISGAAMLMPVFLIGFPLLGVPTLSTVAAVGMSLFLETSGFGTGVYRYVKRGLVDWVTARQLVVITVPAAVVGSLAAGFVDADALRVGYGLAMLALAVVLAREPAHDRSGRVPATGATPAVPPANREQRKVITATGEVYRYVTPRLAGQRVLSGAGAVLAGLISTGVGEATLPGLVRRSRFPLPVAAATSTVVVAATVGGAAITHAIQLARDGGFGAIPWNLLMWAVPGAVIGAVIGTFLQGRIPECATRLFFAGLFGLIGALFVAVFGFGIGPSSLR